MEWLVGISFFALVYGIVYLGIRKSERMALLEAGKDATIFDNGKKVKNLALKWGLLLIGVGLGLVLANILIKLNLMDDEAAYFGMSFLFGGIGLVVSYFIDLSEYKNSKDQQES